MPVHGRILRYVVERTGAKLIPAGYRAFRRYDVRITNQLFGKSGGKGFRHGRDVGLIIGGEYLNGADDLDAPSIQQPPSYKRPQAYYRNQRGRKRRVAKCYPYRNRGFKSKSRYNSRAM